jgi:hypothetical protein
MNQKMTLLVEEFREKISEAIDLAQDGKMKAGREALRSVYQCMKENPFLLWDDVHVSQLGKAIIIMIHWDLIDEEEENIGLAHLAYLYLSKAIMEEEKKHPEVDTCELFRLRKDRIIVLKSFDDFFVDSLIDFYFSDQKAENLDDYNEQRKAVLSRMPLMQFADIYLIEQDYPNLRDDEFLLDLANYIEADEEVNEENLKEAFLLQKILFKHTYDKVKNKTLIF